MPAPIGPRESNHSAFELLMQEYESLRADQRSTHEIGGAIGGGLLAFSGVAVAIFSVEPQTHHYPTWLPAFFPLVPISLAAVFALVFSASRLRARYMRAVEHDLFEAAGRPA